jgi:hypothetical protein
MTAQIDGGMAANLRLATLDDLLPAAGTPRHGWRALASRFSRRRPRGLAAIPERYRLQFLVLADGAMPGRPAAEVVAMADRLADRTQIPVRLLVKLPDTTDLDRWFRDSCERITGCLSELLEAEAQ